MIHNSCPTYHHLLAVVQAFHIISTCVALWCGHFTLSEAAAVDQRLKEWYALNTLTGVASAKRLQQDYCPTDLTKGKFRGHESSYLTSPKDVSPQSDFLPDQLNISIYEQLCRISLGLAPIVKPFNNYEFPFIHNVRDLCEAGQPIDLLILISSEVANFEQREVIRRLWGNGECWLGARVRRVFLLDAQSEVVLPDPGVMEEQDIYNDIIQQQYPINLQSATSYKLLLGIQWSLTFCPQAKWLLFVNEDHFVNPFNAVSFLLSISEAMRQRLVVGSVWYEPTAKVAETVLFRTTAKEPKKRYPTFVATSAMFVSSVLAPSIYLTMRYTEMTTHPDLLFAKVIFRLFLLPAHFDDIYSHDRRPLTGKQKERAIVFPCGGRENQTEMWELLNCEKYCS